MLKKNTSVNKILYISLQIDQIEPGFGDRLREERVRLGKSQAEFADLADVRRLAQSQYEAEATSPTVRYLTVIAAAGADLHYLLFAKRFESPQAAGERLYHAEQQAFKCWRRWNRCGLEALCIGKKNTRFSEPYAAPSMGRP